MRQKIEKMFVFNPERVEDLTSKVPSLVDVRSMAICKVISSCDNIDKFTYMCQYWPISVDTNLSPPPPTSPL